MNEITVSVGIPVYNGEKYVAQAIESLLRQDFDDFEIIISDNASTDSTEAICRAYAAKDHRIRYYRNETNIGSGPNYRRLFDLARGEFFKWLPHDDVVHPRFLSRCVSVMKSSSPSIALVYPRCEQIDDSGRVIATAPDRIGTNDRRPYRRLAKVLHSLSYGYPVDGLFRAELLRKVRVTPPVHYWDLVLLAEVSLVGEIVEVPEVLMQQRLHAENSIAICAPDEWSAVRNDPNKADKKVRRALLAWTDPAMTRKRFWLPMQEERYVQYLKGIHHVSLPVHEKLLCYFTVPVVCYLGRIRKIAGGWRRKLRRRWRVHEQVV
jgi:glycosyltransferase involved in cell wall biosynthesis